MAKAMIAAVSVTYHAGEAGSPVAPLRRVMMNWVVPLNSETPAA
jgi:hypothetical protein